MQYAALSQSKVNRTLMKIGGAGAIVSGVLFLAGVILHLLFDFNMVTGLITLLAWVALIPAVPALYEVAKDRSGALTPVGTFAGAVGVVLGLIGGLVVLTGETILAQAEADTAVILVNIQLIDLFSTSLRQSANFLLVIWLALNGLVNVRLGKASRHWLGFGWYSLILAGMVTVLAVIWLIGLINLELAAVVLFGVAAIWLGVSLIRTR